ncbi:MAG: tetratricopeptide repeat protein [Myxococcales bacterium]|nr:tetratricopeptide repeat protein [Myxococcales bacterium]
METSSPFVFEATTDSFEEAVLTRSNTVPILVDFWAAWCGPCRMLTPILEKIVEAQAGKVLLAKVNTDEQQELAARHRISGIPAVKAYFKGKVVSEFVGARDGRFIEQFIKQLIPIEGDREVSDAAKLLADGMPKEAAEQLQQLLATALPVEVASRARLLLAESQLLIGGADLSVVRGLLAQVDPRSVQSDRAEELLTVIEFMAASDDEGGEQQAVQRLHENDRDSAARYVLAAAQARRGDFASALESLLAIVARDRRFRDDGARKAMAAIFGLLGANSDLSHDFRRRLQVVV